MALKYKSADRRSSTWTSWSLEYNKDPRKVVIDPDARYFGAKLSENSLIPGKDVKLGSTKFGWWLENVAPPPKK